jgi:2-methylcitrate dehydratase
MAPQKAALQHAPADRLLNALAAFTHEAPAALDPKVARGAKVAVMDTLAVALGALRHPAALAARRYARCAEVAHGARLWGSGRVVTAETAALVNGVPLRGYDYNDLYSSKGGGHPSDMIPGLFALAEWRGLPGTALLGAIAVGYEVLLSLFDTLDNHRRGWDYPTSVQIAATCAGARLLGLDVAKTREALAISAICHFASDEVESSELNARGDLTMWKRFNGSDAIRQAVYACLLAEAGVEGAVRPFEGKSGFLAKYGTEGAELDALFDRLRPGRALTRINDVVFKRWPVGSRGQSAIQAALAARAGVRDPWSVKQVRVFSDEMAYDHLVRLREDPWHPISRETADHSLPYIVATAVLDGWVRVESFDLDRVQDPKRQEFLAGRVTIEPSAALAGGAKKGFLSKVEIVTADGRVSVGEAKAPPGHPDQPFSDADFDGKLAENVVPLFGEQRAARISRAVWSLDGLQDLRELTALLVADDPASMDRAA